MLEGHGGDVRLALAPNNAVVENRLNLLCSGYFLATVCSGNYLAFLILNPLLWKVGVNLVLTH